MHVQDVMAHFGGGPRVVHRRYRGDQCRIEQAPGKHNCFTIYVGWLLESARQIPRCHIVSENNGPGPAILIL